MQVLADNGGYVLAEEGSRLLFFKRRILPTWAAFVPGLLAVIGVANAVILMVTGNGAAGVVLLVVGLAAAGGLYAVVRSRRRARATPLVPTDAVVVFDLAGRALLNGSGQVFSTLDQVRVGKAMQLTSSSKALEVGWPGGKCVVYRGDPFVLRGGSIDVPAAELAQRGVSTMERLR